MTEWILSQQLIVLYGYRGFVHDKLLPVKRKHFLRFASDSEVNV